MLVKKAKHQRTQVALFWLQMKRVRRPLDDDQFMFHAAFLERFGQKLRLFHIHGLVRGAVQNQEGRVGTVRVTRRGCAAV